MKASAIIIFFLVLALCHTSFSDDQANSTDDKTNEMDQDAKYHFWEDKWDGEVLRYLEEQGNETLGDAQARQQQLYRSIHVARVADILQAAWSRWCRSRRVRWLHRRRLLVKACGRVASCALGRAAGWIVVPRELG